MLKGLCQVRDHRHRIEALEAERPHIAAVLDELLAAIDRHADEIDPDWQTVQAINRAKAARAALGEKP